MAAAGGGEMKVLDINASPAYALLDDLAASGSLTGSAVDLYKSKYAQLYECVLQVKWVMVAAFAAVRLCRALPQRAHRTRMLLRTSKPTGVRA